MDSLRWLETAFYILLLILHLTIIVVASFFLIGSFIASIQARGVPYVPSYNEDLARMKDQLRLKPGKTMIDLGCGDGKALRFFAREFGIKKGVGYDFNLPALIFGRVMNRMQGVSDIALLQGDFRKVDLRPYDYIYIYLLSEYMAGIEDFVFENMREDAIIISNTFKFAKHEPCKVFRNEKGKERILLYKKDAKLIR